MLVLLGLVLVLAGAFGAIIGVLGAIGSGLHLRLLPARRVTPISDLAGPTPPGPDPGARPRVVVRGRAAPGPGGTYLAPLSGKTCVWYLATQSTGAEEQRRTLDRFPPEPFRLLDADGRPVLVGPHCPGLEMAPSWREARNDPHPWFADPDATPAPTPAGEQAAPEPGDPTGEFAVLEFAVESGTDLLASGDLHATADGTPTLGGDVVLSAAGDVAAAGDPARRSLRRDLALAIGGAVLIGLGSLALTAGHSSSCEARGTALCPAGAGCDPC